jgi:hypothetical protein
VNETIYLPSSFLGKASSMNSRYSFMTRPIIEAVTRPAVDGEIRCAARNFDPLSGVEYRSSPRCENVAEFHWTLRDGSGHKVFCELHARNASRLGLLERVTADNLAVVTEWMIIDHGTPEDSKAAYEALWNRRLAEGHTMYRNGVLYHPDGTTSVFPPRMTDSEDEALSWSCDGHAEELRGASKHTDNPSGTT